MKNLFCGYYRPNDDKFREIWRSATFVLDANILLNMYRYPEEAREQLLNVLKSIEKRLWIPYQAALEFQRNRVSVIAEQHKKFLEVRNILKPSQDAIKEATNQLEALQLKKRHSSIQSIQPDELITSLNKQISDFLSKLTELEAKQLSVTNFDPIRENLDQLLIGKVGDPFSQDEINKIYKEGEARFKNEIPPGYKDQKKETENKSDVFSYAGITYQRKYGDLVLWKQIIRKAKEGSIPSLIFLTDDEKEDWWWITHSQGKKKIGPRPELVDEIFREANTGFFYMYNSEQFLKYSKDYLNTQVTDESISQIREVTKESSLIMRQKNIEFRKFESIAMRAVLRWLSKAFPTAMIDENDRFPDYIVSDPESGRNLGFEVKMAMHLLHLELIFRGQKSSGYSEINNGYLDEITFVFVMPDGEKLERGIQYFERNKNQLPLGVKFLLGTVNTEGEDELTDCFYPVIEISREE